MRVCAWYICDGKEHFSHPNLAGRRDNNHIMCFMQSLCSDRMEMQLPAVLEKVSTPIPIHIQQTPLPVRQTHCVMIYTWV